MDEKALDIARLKSFSPLDGLKGDTLRSLAKKTTVRELPAGRVLFKPGDIDKRTYYVVNGSVDIFDNGGRIVSTNANHNRHPGRYCAKCMVYNFNLLFF